jgi:hypothetical protein
MSRAPLSPDELRLILMARPLQAILRPCVRAHPFRLAGETLGTARSDARFSEDLVLRMVGRGLLTVTQCAKALPVWQQPGVTEDRPFAMILSKTGVEQRAMHLADVRCRAAANDTADQGSAAA